MIRNCSLAFAWSGLPDYAARCIREVINRYPGRVTVVGTRSTRPIYGIEESLGQAVVWIDGNDARTTWQDLGLVKPDLFFQGGYALPAFKALGLDVRRSGGKVVGLSDASWQGGLQQLIIDPFRHRLFLNRHFDGWFVPGRSGLRHSRWMGHPPEFTHSGMLGADPTLFAGGEKLELRPKTILFVGSLDHNKNVAGLFRAFSAFAEKEPGWTLQICGSGPLNDAVATGKNVLFEGFVQPARLADLMRRARCLALPSRSEAWGLVAHEAASCGCALALSSSVGSLDDLGSWENSVTFRPGCDRAIERALLQLAAWDDSRWQRAEQVSRTLAKKFGPTIFAEAITKFVDIFAKKCAESQRM